MDFKKETPSQLLHDLGSVFSFNRFLLGEKLKRTKVSDAALQPPAEREEMERARRAKFDLERKLGKGAEPSGSRSGGRHSRGGMWNKKLPEAAYFDFNAMNRKMSEESPFL